jgi:hypothetical protein
MSNPWSQSFEELRRPYLEEKKKGDGNLANNYPPYDKVTRGDIIAGATGEDQEGGKKKKKKEVEEGYQEIDREKESKMYRRAGNLARTSLSSKGKEKEDARNKSAKIVSAITRQKENERFNRIGQSPAHNEEFVDENRMASRMEKMPSAPAKVGKATHSIKDLAPSKKPSPEERAKARKALGLGEAKQAFPHKKVDRQVYDAMDSGETAGDSGDAAKEKRDYDRADKMRSVAAKYGGKTRARVKEEYVDESVIGDRARNAVADQRLDAAQRDTQQSVDKLAKREKVTRASASLAAKRVEGDVRKSNNYAPQRPKPGTTGGYRIEEKEDADPCWKDYTQVGMKDKGGKKVPNCVPSKGVPKAKGYKKESSDWKTELGIADIIEAMVSTGEQNKKLDVKKGIKNTIEINPNLKLEENGEVSEAWYSGKPKYRTTASGRKVRWDEDDRTDDKVSKKLYPPKKAEPKETKEEVVIEDREMRRLAAQERAAERTKESKRGGARTQVPGKIGKSNAKSYANKTMQEVDYIDKKTKGKHTIGNPFPEEVQYVDNEELDYWLGESQEARNNPEKYEREQNKKYAPVRGEKTPMPPRGNKKREDFEKWYAANGPK